jgi:hypothetical protein
MEYIVTSPTQVGGKSAGETFTEQELLDLGASIDFLLASGGIAKKQGTATQAPSARHTPEVKETPKVDEIKDTFNNEGDK